MPHDSQKSTILIVEDELGPRNALQVILRPFYNLRTVDSGRAALSALQEQRIDLMTLDMKLPDGHGLDILQQVKTQHHDLEVVVITGYGSLQSAMDSVRFGAAAYLLKPFNVTELLAIITQALNRKRRLEALRDGLVSPDCLWGTEEEVAASWNGLRRRYREARAGLKGDQPGATDATETIELLSELLEAYDRRLFHHANQTSFYAGFIGKHLALTDTERKALPLGAFLHDIGTVACGHDGEVARPPLHSRLAHPEIGARMILPLGLPAEVGQIVLYHHERYDGSGYPYGLQAEGIPLPARIVAVAHAFDRLTSECACQTALSADDAIHQIQQERGRRFDPVLTDILARGVRDCATSLPTLAAASRHSLIPGR